MNRSCFAVSALAMLAVAVPTLASAQEINQTPIGVSIRGGVFFPIQSNPRSTATVWPALGAQVRIMKLDLSTPPDTVDSLALSVDWYGRSGWSQAPVLLNFVSRTGQVFFDAGAGIGFSNEPAGTGTNFAFQAGVGYDFRSKDPETFFVEAKFWGSDRSDLDGFAAYVGVHF